MSAREWEHGDEVTLADAPDRRNPHTFGVRYHTGAVRLYDRYGYPVRLNADEAAEVLGGGDEEIVTDGGTRVVSEPTCGHCGADLEGEVRVGVDVWAVFVCREHVDDVPAPETCTLFPLPRAGEAAQA